MATYGEAIDLIVSEFARGDTSITAVVQAEFLKAIEFYGAERFWFNEARISFTASSTIFYPLSGLSATLTEIDQVAVTVSGQVIELGPMTAQEMQRVDTNGVTGYPTHWSIFAEQIRLYPKPASAYQVDLMGTKKLASLTASTQSNSWTTEALNLIAARVKKVIAAKRHKDYDAARVHEIAESEEYVRLKDRSNRYISTGKISPGY